MRKENRYRPFILAIIRAVGQLALAIFLALLLFISEWLPIWFFNSATIAAVLFVTGLLVLLVTPNRCPRSPQNRAPIVRPILTSKARWLCATGGAVVMLMFLSVMLLVSWFLPTWWFYDAEVATLLFVVGLTMWLLTQTHSPRSLETRERIARPILASTARATYSTALVLSMTMFLAMLLSGSESLPNLWIYGVVVIALVFATRLLILLITQALSRISPDSGTGTVVTMLTFTARAIYSTVLVLVMAMLLGALLPACVIMCSETEVLPNLLFYGAAVAVSLFLIRLSTLLVAESRSRRSPETGKSGVRTELTPAVRVIFSAVLFCVCGQIIALSAHDAYHRHHPRNMGQVINWLA